MHIFRRSVAVVLLTLACTGAVDARQNGPASSERSESRGLQVTITSPLGRTGMNGPVRIVARVATVADTILSPVQFYVDKKLVGEDKDGAPYAVEWVDQNPFERREILVQVADSTGATATDVIELKPLEIVESSTVASVLLEPAVTDAAGRPINNLTLADFEAFENGVRQELDMAASDTIPATYTLLIDSSQSMSRRMEFVRQAARLLPQRLRAHDSVMIVPFSQTLGVVTGPTQDRDTISDAIRGIRSSGGTAILDSLSKLAANLRQIDSRHIVVLITDGYDENSAISYDEALKALRASQATVYVVAVAGVAGVSLKGEELLRRLATATGGRAFFPYRDVQLAEMNDRIAEDVQARYILTYSPTNQKLDGTWREIRLTTSDPGHIVRVRAGYFAPAPPPIKPQIEMTVRDLQRRYIDITPDDLIVLEDGVEQKVEAFEESLTPVSLVLSLDSSGSIKAEAEAVLEAARNFVRSLPRMDRLSLMTFADKTTTVHDLNTMREWTMAGMSRYTVGGGTALYDAIWDGITMLERAPGRSAIVILTDGRDENNPGTAPGSVRTLDEILEALRARKTPVYAIGLGPKVDRATLEKIAAASNGEAYFPQQVSELDGEYRRVLENMRRRYVLSYTSTNSNHDGGWREVEIRSKRAGIVIDSQAGYSAPGGN